MMEHIGRWFLLVCCIVAVTSAAPDTVLRFLSHKEVVRMEQEAGQTHKDITVESSGYPEGQPMEKFRVQNIVCPNGETQCPDTSTCCPLQYGEYGCCEGVNAVCCKDGTHCCPKGYQCDEQHQRCTSHTLGISFGWTDKKVQRARPLALDVRLRANITCPDKETVCQVNDTCCLVTPGYRCCPLLHGVCCSDRLHCCPQGTKCDLVHHRCNREGSDWEQPWVERRLEQSHSEVSQATTKKKAVICKDGLMCPDGNTCCLLNSGSYGCCPYSDAVCCSDQVHCCPHDCHCDYVKKACAKLSPVSDALNLKGVICPGGQSTCPDGSTCCKMTTGIWGCCLHPQAVCCSDHIHCCPHDKKCNLSSGACNGNSSQPLSRKIPAVPREKVTSVICPDNSTCSDKTTCCKDVAGGYACCPYKQAVCCSDKIHCCPNGYTCDMVAKTCTMHDTSIPWMEKKPSMPSALNLKDVVCPGGQSTCPDGSTCCQMTSGIWGCCPHPKAVCCSDHIHCCPHDMKCNLSAGACDGNSSQPLSRKIPAVPRVQSVICPDKQSECPDGTTCCKMPSGQYGCCGKPNAVCCSDGSHCCPQGFTCDVARHMCVTGQRSVPWLKKLTAVSRVESVVCPDGKSQCPDGNTCCKMSTGAYSCCPMSDAVCCADGIHCCPKDTKCDAAHKACRKGDDLVPWEVKRPAGYRVESVVCPGGKMQCPDGNTCCKMSTGAYGCCPMSDAVCCADGIHCCPKDTKCDVAHKTCRRGDDLVPWEVKRPAEYRVESVVCPGGKMQCPDGNTCCEMSTGAYGCCPMSDAVCCADGIHCCPKDTKCDVAHKTCRRGDDLVPWEVKRPAEYRVESVVCPGGKMQCPDGNTCCEMSTGAYGCCPMSDAVCCADGIHCCPKDTKCDVAHKTCRRGDDLVPWEVKRPAEYRVESVVCPGGKMQCPDGNTCCEMSTGAYGCCPMSDAVCCADRIHCCPKDTKCDVAHKTCRRGDDLVPWELKRPAGYRVESVVCPDGKMQCPDGNTCCKMSTGAYGCCPMSDAVCCADGIHCCPKDTKCDVAHKACQRGDDLVRWELKRPAGFRLP
ncbi:hypothetical protein ACOMHN_054301 [Nucella lapillus]